MIELLVAAALANPAIRDAGYSALEVQCIVRGLDCRPAEEIKLATNPIYCSCVRFLQSKGIPISGDAIDQIPNHYGVPEKGDVVIWRYPDGTGHVSLIMAVEGSKLTVDEGNWRPCVRTQREVVWAGNEDIVGFIRPLSALSRVTGI